MANEEVKPIIKATPIVQQQSFPSRIPRKISPTIIKDLQPDSNPSLEMLKLSTFLKDYLCWGKVEIVVKNGRPVFITHAYRDIKLTID
jgi:hypothetical protein